ncbi:MAG: hypothetical protein Q9160_004728, partial [Pyrenula sp. 1 TL-2023]
MAWIWLLLSPLFHELASAWTECTIVTTTTNLVFESPAWIYPLPYIACHQCSAVIITDANQPITSSTVNYGTITEYIAPWWDWSFQPTKTVTVIVYADFNPSSQVQTWSVDIPTFAAIPITSDNTVIQNFYYEQTIVYVKETNYYGVNIPVTVTSTSTVYSALTSPPAPSVPPSLGPEQISGSIVTLHSGPQSGPGNTGPGSVTAFFSGYPSVASFSINSHGDSSNSGFGEIVTGNFYSSTQGSSVLFGTTNSGRLPDGSAGGGQLSSISSSGPFGPSQVPLSSSNTFNAPASPISSALGSAASDGTFQLYIDNDVPGLNTLAVGEDGNGNLVVGGVIEATVLLITVATNMTDLSGNYIYFVPKVHSTRAHQRQNADPTLQYSPNPPQDAVISGFAVENITLSSTSTQGNFTFYTCTRTPDAQPIFVAELGQVPGNCFNFDLVTNPPDLSNNTNATTTSTQTDILATSTVTSINVSSNATSGMTVSSISPTVVRSIDGYYDQGLFNNPSTSQVPMAASTVTPLMTVTLCASFCSKYPYFGVEAGMCTCSKGCLRLVNIATGTICYCAGSLTNQQSPASDQSGASNVACGGNNTQFCGGDQLIEIYAIVTVTSLSHIVSSSAVTPQTLSSLTSYSQIFLSTSASASGPLTIYSPITSSSRQQPLESFPAISGPFSATSEPPSATSESFATSTRNANSDSATSSSAASPTVVQRAGTLASTTTASITVTLTITVPSGSAFATTTTATIYSIVAYTVTKAAREIEGRQAAETSFPSFSTPSALIPFPDDILSSGCSLEAIPVTRTSTVVQYTTVSQPYTAELTTPATTQVTTLLQSTTTTQTVTIDIYTNPSSTYTTTTTIVSTTTITVASGAPSAVPQYLAISPDPNPNAGWALSDPATHLTDNFYFPNRREVFQLTSIGQPYSVTNNSWYYVSPPKTTTGKMFWSTSQSAANKTFYGVPLDDGTGRTRLFLNKTIATPPAPFNFCVATNPSGDGNP